MEGETPFNLSEEIAAWRRQLARQPTLRPEAREELEHHALESFHRLHAGGMGEEEAWKAAVARLGEPAVIDREFAKVRPRLRLLRAATAFLVSYAVFVLLLNAWRWVEFGTAAGLMLNLWPEALPAVGLHFVCIILPLVGLFRILKWEPPRWVAFGMGTAVSLLVGLILSILSKGRPGAEGWVGMLACGAGLAVYVRFALSPVMARMLSGVWMAMSGAAFCGLMMQLFGPHGSLLRGYLDWASLLFGPVVFGLRYCVVVAPIGALLGFWLPTRLDFSAPLRSVLMGSLFGAGVATSLLAIQYLWMDVMLVMRSGEMTSMLAREVREFNLQQATRMFAIIVPSAALWTGLWALKISKSRHLTPVPAG